MANKLIKEESFRLFIQEHLSLESGSRETDTNILFRREFFLKKDGFINSQDILILSFKDTTYKGRVEIICTQYYDVSDYDDISLRASLITNSTQLECIIGNHEVYSPIN